LSSNGRYYACEAEPSHTPASWPAPERHLRPRPHRRRQLSLDLPEFLIRALAARVDEANVGAVSDEICTLEGYIESELVNLITIRDIAELESEQPGFALAVNKWLEEVRS
jgi:hypothetical protein